MKIEFLFNGINDIEKLYQITYEKTTKDEKVPLSHKYIGADYLQNQMEKVIKTLSGVEKYSYGQNFDRIANEVFVVIASGKHYEVIFTIDTYKYEKTRMKIRIYTSEDNGIQSKKYAFDDGIEYDIFLEQLKISIKNVLKRDWAVCSWITDEQSEKLCSHLYPNIFKVENQIRAFANKILLHTLGKDWIKLPGLEKYAKSCRALSADFKRKVPCFADIDDTFISMTIETMVEIILEAKIYEEEISLSSLNSKTLHQKISENAANSLLDMIKGERKVKINIWEDIFKQYFEVENTKDVIEAFKKNRNHVAHNKLLNWSGYQVMDQNIKCLGKIIEKANKRFEASIPSEEQYLTWNNSDDEQQESMNSEWENNYLLLRIFGETGIEIRDTQEIFELFMETLDELYADFSDKYYFDPKFEVSRQNDIDLQEEEQLLFTIKSNAYEYAQLNIIVDMSIDSIMDGDSTMWLYCRENDEELFQCELRYHNGCGAEDTFEGKIVLNSESHYDMEELQEFKIDLQNYVEDELNPLIAQKERLENIAGKRDGDYPVADIPCSECGEYGISISDDFYPFGHCCYCGEENYIEQCEDCGQWYGEGYGERGICNECLEHYLGGD